MKTIKCKITNEVEISEMLVDAYMRVIKKEPFDSPLHWKYDHENHKFIV